MRQLRGCETAFFKESVMFSMPYDRESILFWFGEGVSENGRKKKSAYKNVQIWLLFFVQKRDFRQVDLRKRYQKIRV